MYTMKIQLLTDEQQHEKLMDVMKRFNEICNHISEVGFRTKSHRNKIKLSSECYADVRQKFMAPAQMVVRAIGKVVEAYKGGSKTVLRFGENTSVVYDTRLLAFKWMHSVSIATFNGRIEVPFRVTGYRQGSYERRVTGQADLILLDNVFYILLLVNLPEESNITSMEFAGVAT
jgi:putative transposase